MITADVTTFAGICDSKSKGFKDGPQGVSLFNQPDGIGIDEDGNVYVFDSGNKYMRMITPEGAVSTLVNGACFEYLMNEPLLNSFGVRPSYLLCYRKWIKTYGKPDEHLYIDTFGNICYKTYAECGQETPLIYDRNKTLYNK